MNVTKRLITVIITVPTLLAPIHVIVQKDLNYMINITVDVLTDMKLMMMMNILALVCNNEFERITLLIDTNECERKMDKCSNNTNGSYLCSCQTEYVLSDSYTCGKQHCKNRLCD